MSLSLWKCGGKDGSKWTVELRGDGWNGTLKRFLGGRWYSGLAWWFALCHSVYEYEMDVLLDPA